MMIGSPRAGYYTLLNEFEGPLRVKLSLSIKQPPGTDQDIDHRFSGARPIREVLEAMADVIPGEYHCITLNPFKNSWPVNKES